MHTTVDGCINDQVLVLLVRIKIFFLNFAPFKTFCRLRKRNSYECPILNQKYYHILDIQRVRGPPYLASSVTVLLHKVLQIRFWQAIARFKKHSYFYFTKNVVFKNKKNLNMSFRVHKKFGIANWLD